MFCHGVTACAAAALHIENSLCSSVVSAVCCITEDCYLSAAVYPANIIRDASFNYYFCAKHSHTAKPLPHGSFNSNLDDLTPWPDAAADTVLAVSNNMEFSCPLPYSFLYLFLKYTGGSSFTVNISFKCYFFSHNVIDLSLRLVRNPSGKKDSPQAGMTLVLFIMYFGVCFK